MSVPRVCRAVTTPSANPAAATSGKERTPVSCTCRMKILNSNGGFIRQANASSAKRNSAPMSSKKFLMLCTNPTVPERSLTLRARDKNLLHFASRRLMPQGKEIIRDRAQKLWPGQEGFVLRKEAAVMWKGRAGDVLWYNA